jgi:hypothetical protein
MAAKENRINLKQRFKELQEELNELKEGDQDQKGNKQLAI